jgi:predicted FMN-binding regulatory protein PaiB
MYIPGFFHETDLRQLDWLAEHDAFGTLVSVHEGTPFATHLPVLYRRNESEVTLTGHWARANPQWSTIEGQRALFIFHGPTFRRAGIPTPTAMCRHGTMRRAIFMVAYGWSTIRRS